MNLPRRCIKKATPDLNQE